MVPYCVCALYVPTKMRVVGSSGSSGPQGLNLCHEVTTMAQHFRGCAYVCVDMLLWDESEPLLSLLQPLTQKDEADGSSWGYIKECVSLCIQFFTFMHLDMFKHFTQTRLFVLCHLCFSLVSDVWTPPPLPWLHERLTARAERNTKTLQSKNYFIIVFLCLRFFAFQREVQLNNLTLFPQWVSVPVMGLIWPSIFTELQSRCHI